MRGTTLTAIAVLASATIAAALPLLVLVFGVPVSEPDVHAFARLHLHPAFGARATLTFAYFPAIIVLHWLIRPENAPASNWYLLGFGLFLLGNGIDAAYRAVQYLVAHAVWAPAVLSAGAESAAAAKIATFNEYSPAIGFSFAVFFAVGRLVMGGALLASGIRLGKLAGAAIVLNGLWNLSTVLSTWAPLGGLSALGAWYLWPWLLAIVAAGAFGWRREQERTPSHSSPGKLTSA